jgi:hypothetical protein
MVCLACINGTLSWWQPIHDTSWYIWHSESTLHLSVFRSYLINCHSQFFSLYIHIFSLFYFYCLDKLLSISCITML